MALIFEGQLPPGSRLPAERELAELLGVSRPILREALNQLEARRLIERRSKSGNYVCTAIPESLREPIEEIVDSNIVGLKDVIEIRKVLELWAVQKAARSASRESVATLERCIRTMKETAELRTEEQFRLHRAADMEFHETLARMTGNPIYVHLFHFFAKLVSRSILLSRRLLANGFPESNLRVHEEILNAIRQRDPSKAKEAVRAHFQMVENELAAEEQEGRTERARAERLRSMGL